jgi:hypothetical protein
VADTSEEYGQVHDPLPFWTAHQMPAWKEQVTTTGRRGTRHV